MSSLSERLAQKRDTEVIPLAPQNTLGQRVAKSSPERAAEDALAPIKARIHTALLERMGPRMYSADTSTEALEQVIRELTLDILTDETAPLTALDRTRLIQEVADDITGHGPLEPLLRDSTITEIIVNSWDHVYVESGGQLRLTGVRFDGEEHLRRTIEKIVARVGRRVDEASPMVDARLPDGSRVNAVIPPIAIDGSALTIRKFSVDPLTVDDLIAFGSLTQETAELLEGCVRGRLNVVISGGTGSGKTTLLNVLSSFIPSEERIVTIEDAAELQLQQEHVVRLESRPANIEGRGEVNIRDLVRNSLRMRPDRIIVGETRDAAALDMLQAMNTGHDGSLTTVHANTPRDAVARLETMVLMAGLELPAKSIREQIASAVHIIIQAARLKDGSRKITHITEVVGLEGDIISMQDLYTFDYRGSTGKDGILVSAGIRPTFVDELRAKGVRLPAAFNAFSG